MKVAILGCGPAGLFAAHAANRAGAEYTIYSRKVRSNIAGAQFLHVPIPGIEEEADQVTIVRWGTPAVYADKATGKLQELGLDTSWTRWETHERATIWSLARAYDNAWRGYENDIQNQEVDFKFVDWCVSEYDLVVSTVPLDAIIDPALLPALGLLKQIVYIVPAPRVRGNVLVFNGSHNEGQWYRYSCLFGHSTYEFSDRADAEEMAHHLETKVITARKPYAIVSPKFENMHPNVLKVGRHGRWHKLGLTHEAFYMTYSEILKGTLDT